MAKKPQQNPADLAKQASKLGELKVRILFLIGALIVYRIGTFIPVPGVNPAALAALFDQQQGTILDMFNMFSGGALERASLFALGIMPYISAAIIMQLMSAVIPSLEQLKKEGESGRRKITQYTRYGTVVLGIFQSVGIAIALQGQTAGGENVVVNQGVGFVIIASVALVTGTMFLMWLGEQITERGVGNGISLIIFAGIVCRLPAATMNLFRMLSTGVMGLFPVLILIALMVAVWGSCRMTATPAPATTSSSSPAHPRGPRFPRSSAPPAARFRACPPGAGRS